MFARSPSPPVGVKNNAISEDDFEVDGIISRGVAVAWKARIHARGGSMYHCTFIILDWLFQYQIPCTVWQSLSKQMMQ